MICPSQTIPMNERQQIRIKQKGNDVDFRILARGKMGLWKPTSHAITVSIERLITLQSESKEIINSFPTLKNLVETLNKYGVEIPAEIQNATETMATAIKTYKDEHEKEIAIFEMRSMEAILKLKEVKL